MSINKIIIFTILSLWITIVPVKVLAQNVVTYGPQDSLTAGEVFNLSLKVENDGTYDKIIFPDSTSFENFLNLEFRNRQHFKISSRVDSVNYSLQFFGFEDLVIAPLPVKMVKDGDTTIVFTETLPLFFKSVNDTNTEEFAPIKPIFVFSSKFWLWVVEILIVLLIAYLIYLKHFKHRRPAATEEQAEVPIFENPIEALELRLLHLKDRHGRETEKDYKYFYSELGDAIRSYLEMVYEIKALEMTTREINRHLDAFGVDSELTKATKSILSNADMVKFANRIPSQEESWKAFDLGMGFYERAKIRDIERISRKKEEFEASLRQPVAEEARDDEEEDFDDLG